MISPASVYLFKKNHVLQNVKGIYIHTISIQLEAKEESMWNSFFLYNWIRCISIEPIGVQTKNVGIYMHLNSLSVLSVVEGYAFIPFSFFNFWIPNP